MAAPDAAPPPLNKLQAATEEQQPLCAQLSASSRGLHSRSNAVVQSRLIVLFTDRTLYGQALACFLPVFQALEEQVRLHRQDNADIAAVWESMQPLLRAEGFEQDLEFYLGPGWQEQVPRDAKAVNKYVAHLKALGASDPTLLLAHCFTQLVGLASGGQVIRRMARKRFNLPDGQGTSAFEYPGQKASAQALKGAFMQQLNALGQGFTPERRLQLVAEHHQAFHHNNAIIAEFRIGWWRFWRGLVRLVPPLTRVSLVILLGAGAAAYLYPRPAP